MRDPLIKNLNAIRTGPPDDLRTLVDLHQRMRDQGMAFCYRGPFLERFTNTILDISESAAASGDNPLMSRKVSFLLVECFQNILRHGESLDADTTGLQDDGLFGFRSIGGTFVINSINLVHRDACGPLQELVDTINRMDGRELKELYLQQLSYSEFSAKGGAGLGLIELARKSGKKLLYSFEPVTETISFFHQQVTFTPEQDDTAPLDLIADTRAMYDLMAREKIFLHYKGDFSQRAILPLLEIVEHNVAGGIAVASRVRRTGHVLIEMLQNISRHTRSMGVREEGIFLIGAHEQSIFLEAGNVVTDSDRAFLEEKLRYLAELNQDEMAELHKTALRASLKFENKHKSGLGLIEIARAARAPLQWRFAPTPSGDLLFALHVNI